MEKNIHIKYIFILHNNTVVRKPFAISTAKMDDPLRVKNLNCFKLYEKCKLNHIIYR